MSPWEKQDGSEESAHSRQGRPLAASSAQSLGFLSWYKGPHQLPNRKTNRSKGTKFSSGIFLGRAKKWGSLEPL